MDKVSNLKESIQNVSSLESYEIIKKDSNTFLIDVRTEQEWIQVGYPNLEDSFAQLIKLSWRELPDMTINSSFSQVMMNKIIDKTSKLFFICKSGGRSFEAAQAMNMLGYKNCYNVIDGFEGSYSNKTLLGWKLSNLPWEQ